MSTHLIARRWLKAQAARLLPEGLKKRVRGRLYGYRKARVMLPVTFTSDVVGPVVVIDDRIRLRFNDADRPAVRTHLTDHGAAVEEMASFINVAADAATLFDIGADRAIFSLVFCAMGEGKRAVADQPSASRMMAASGLTALNLFQSRLMLRQAALGTSHGRTSGTLFADGIMVAESHDPAGQAADMEMTTVDREVDALGIVPDVMKIDVEGYEYEVLRGARRLLVQRKPVLCLELHLDLLERRGLSPTELVADLASLGYRFRSCVGRELRPSDITDSVHAILRCVAY